MKHQLIEVGTTKTTISLVPPDPLADAWLSGIARVQRMFPPAGFAMDRWAQIGTDCAVLIHRHGGDLRRLGWSAVELFGAHPDAPAVAVRCYGLGLLISGGEVVELTAERARIKRPSGAVLTCQRAAGPGAVPIWEVPG